MRILFTSAGSGRRVRLIKAFEEASAKIGRDVAIYISTNYEFDIGVYLFRNSVIMPPTSSPEFVDILLSYCKDNGIEWIIPTTDEDLMRLAGCRDEFKKNGINIIVSGNDVIEKCTDKYLFYRWCEESGLPIAKTRTVEVSGGTAGLFEDYPYYIKPRFGAGARNNYFAPNKERLESILDLVDQPVVQKFLDMPEYTIDAILGFDSKLITFVPRERISVYNGVSSVGRTAPRGPFAKLVQNICEKMNFIGAINIQVFHKGDEIYLSEINPRFSGGIPLSIMAGVDFPLLLLKLMLGQKIRDDEMSYCENYHMFVYEDALYKQF